MPEPAAAFVRVLAARLYRKVVSMVPVLVAGVAIFGVVWVALQLVTPYLPDHWQQTLELLQRGDWREASERIREMLETSVVPPELAFVALQIVQVLVAPIPGQLAGFAAGYLFGFWVGLLLTMTGLTIGSFLAMGLGRIFGIQVVRRFVPTALLSKLDELIAKGGLWNFLVIFMLPGLPDDAICFVAGLTRLPLWKLMLVMALGRLPGMAVLCFVGSSIGEGGSQGYAVFGIAMALSFLVWLFSDEIETLVMPAAPSTTPESHRLPGREG